MHLTPYPLACLRASFAPQSRDMVDTLRAYVNGELT